ncbi:hypothetical protein SAMN04488136_1175 [Vibrio xiamenensis]|uniref:Uncharacterized protein n=1 Tax=Vibrio xiamenensis TaxID=861298 RepID=A0A1G8CPI0_9VIBR|nr:hypothetical protein SAMN04488136_1175 [Vibrio xiamenensis]
MSVRAHFVYKMFTNLLNESLFTYCVINIIVFVYQIIKLNPLKIINQKA